MDYPAGNPDRLDADCRAGTHEHDSRSVTAPREPICCNSGPSLEARIESELPRAGSFETAESESGNAEGVCGSPGFVRGVGELHCREGAAFEAWWSEFDRGTFGDARDESRSAAWK